MYTKKPERKPERKPEKKPSYLFKKHKHELERKLQWVHRNRHFRRFKHTTYGQTSINTPTPPPPSNSPFQSPDTSDTSPDLKTTDNTSTVPQKTSMIGLSRDSLHS